MKPMLREVTCQDHTTSEWKSWDKSQGFCISKLMPTILKNVNGYYLLNTENVPSVVLSTWHTLYL